MKGKEFFIVGNTYLNPKTSKKSTVVKADDKRVLFKSHDNVMKTDENNHKYSQPYNVIQNYELVIN